jgi:hypothetical protein
MSYTQAELRAGAAANLREMIDIGYFDGEGGLFSFYDDDGDPTSLSSVKEELISRQEAEGMLRDLEARCADDPPVKSAGVLPSFWGYGYVPSTDP